MSTTTIPSVVTKLGFDPGYLPAFEDKLFIEGVQTPRRLTNFFALLLFATVIATYGVLSGSTATVIGAMIVAPLMLPIMGLAFGVSLGDRRAILRSLAISLAGIGTAIAAGWVLTRGFSSVVDVESNSQIMARTSPKLIDLLAALATGLAGAYATGRKDVSDTLPGVAIAISLVPPLANVGILLATGDRDLALGSLLLFVTNYLAILLTGAFMFGIMGYPRAYNRQRSKKAKATALAVALALGLVIVIPLAAHSVVSISTHIAEGRSTDAADAWLQGSSYRLVSTEVVDGRLRIVVAGEGPLPPQGELEDALRGEVFDLPVTLEVVPERRVEFQTADGTAR
jgi:uncharacterized hydrophobic protein (TIGR00271 family)